MSLKDTVRQKFEQAKRSANREEKNLLSVILGDISTAEARSGKELPDTEGETVLDEADLVVEEAVQRDAPRDAKRDPTNPRIRLPRSVVRV